MFVQITSLDNSVDIIINLDEIRMIKDDTPAVIGDVPTGCYITWKNGTVSYFNSITISNFTEALNK